MVQRRNNVHNIFKHQSMYDVNENIKVQINKLIYAIIIIIINVNLMFRLDNGINSILQ